MTREDRIVVITYDFPHRKTQDVVFGLKVLGYQNVTLLALPFVQRKSAFSPIYKHRPSDAHQVYPEFLAENFDYKFKKVEADQIAENINSIRPKATLIAGAGILPADLVNNHSIINSHPAYLPEVRGLDALKWAIYNQSKIGVTTHFVDENADAGFLIDRREVPIYDNDTFHSLAYRQYSIEIEMLLEAIELSTEISNFPKLEEKGDVHRRMPKAKESELLNKFEEYKIKFAIN